MRTILLLALLLSSVVTTPIDARENEAPAYSRQRMGGGGGYMGMHGNGRQAGRHAGYFPGYYPYQPIVAGNWYARPYPYHFDYYRWRYSTPPQPSDCPCAETPLQ